MNRNLILIICSAITVSSVPLGMWYDAFGFLIFLIEIPTFAGSFLILSFFKKSTKFKIIVSLPIAFIIPLWSVGGIFLGGGLH